ncbi:hypothetical protein IDH20_04375 [Pelagibacterales bacterium SAG-MED39]|nr:hypothetical protein [Pelagibacterales bacterium SAG-MED39]
MKKISWYYKRIIFFFKKKINIDNDLFISNNLNELFNHYGSDKGTIINHPYNKKGEKIIGHSFGDFYEKYFFKFKDDKFNFLEIGTWKGASLAAFKKYFINASIYGIDRNYKIQYKSNKLKYYNCDTTNNSDLKNIEKKFGNIKFRIIIDDGSHFLNDIIHNLKFFFRFVESGGLYVIEDFKHPELFKHLNDSDNNELIITELIDKLKKKKLFPSRLLTKENQLSLINDIKKISTYKGTMINNKINLSNIVFFEKI